jgi:anthranilate synthase component 2
MILMIDNYDSFTYNLVQLIGGLDPNIDVIRNDAMTVPEIEKLKPSHIILSPGPGYPKDAGVCEDVIRALGGKVPILGVCLGHQAICEAYGAMITHAARLMHGKKSVIHIDTNSPIFMGLPEKIEAARYHSLIARRDTIPETLTIIAQDTSGEIMAVRHRDYDVYGLQFHPESVLTSCGETIIRNFLRECGSFIDSTQSFSESAQSFHTSGGGSNDQGSH